MKVLNIKACLLFLILLIGSTFHAQKSESTVKIRKQTRVLDSDTDKRQEKRLDVTKEIVDGKTITKYKLKTMKDGLEEIISWNGEGDMPQEIAEALAEGSSNESTIVKEEQKQYLIEVDEGGVKKRIAWNGEGDMPEELKEAMEKVEMEETYVIENGEVISRSVNTSTRSKVKVSLGIMITSDLNGVRVKDIVKGSPADKAGITAEDVILKIGDRYIFTDDTLFDQLSSYSPGDKVNIVLLRKGKERSLNLTLDSKK